MYVKFNLNKFKTLLLDLTSLKNTIFKFNFSKNEVKPCSPK